MNTTSNLFVSKEDVIKRNLKYLLVVKNLEDNAMTDCSNIEKIEILEGVTTIGKEAFQCCHNLRSIRIPASITSIGSYAFCECENLTDVYYNGTLEKWCDINFIDEVSNPLCYAKHFYVLDENDNWCEVTDIVIPEGVTEIKETTFYLCTALKSIIVPDAVLSIGRSAFLLCQALSTVTIGKGLKTIPGGNGNISHRVGALVGNGRHRFPRGKQSQ